jgi:hypothetical protein
MNALARLGIALLPAALTPLLVVAIGSDWISLGGGEKDLVVAIPWALWSVIFAVSSLVLWRRGWSLSRSIRRSAVVGLAGVVLAAALLAAVGQLGVAGRF